MLITLSDEVTFSEEKETCDIVFFRTTNKPIRRLRRKTILEADFNYRQPNCFNSLAPFIWKFLIITFLFHHWKTIFLSSGIACQTHSLACFLCDSFMEQVGLHRNQFEKRLCVM